jgi:nucleoside-diphosphate-sugar epimerase
VTGTLVTGATGGLGAIFAKWLRDNRSEQVWRSGRRQLADSDYHACDLTDANATRGLIAKLRPRAIFHMAGEFTSSFDAGYSVNVLGARHIIEALIAEKIEARVVLLGSAAEYGVVSGDDNPIGEDRVLRPVSAYGVTKAWQTQLGFYFAHNSAVEIVIARMFNLLAPGLSARLFVGSVEAQIAACLSGDATEIIVGNLDAERDYVRVDQAIDQLSMIAAHGKSGEVYHVASGKPISMRALLHTMLSDAGLDPSIVRENAAEVGRRRHDVPLIYADMTKTRNLESWSHG